MSSIIINLHLQAIDIRRLFELSVLKLDLVYFFEYFLNVQMSE